MRYLIAIFLLLGLYGIATAQLGAGVMSFLMAIFMCYCYKKVRREDVSLEASKRRDVESKTSNPP